MLRAVAGLIASRVRRLGPVCCLGGLLGLAGCARTPGSEASPVASSSAVPGGLSPELASEVLARVGDRTITLGEYAAVLERMDRFERMRYQSPERRRLLLDEIIRVEVLADEARRRGLDREPETAERVRQVLRDELLRRLRESLPGPEAIPEAEVRAYYEAHRGDFEEPERRRVAAIALGSRAAAERVLADAKRASAGEWGKLVALHGSTKPAGSEASAPMELAGDLGIVSLGRPGDNPKVPEPVARAVFEITAVGGVHEEVVEALGKFHVVRLLGRTEARSRGFADAERSIRVSLVQARIRAAEAELEQQLRERYPVKVDDAALAQVQVQGAEQADAGAGSSGPKR